MRRKFLKAIAALTVSAFATVSAIMPSSAAAENEKAAEIRDIFNSKTYYIEYEYNSKNDKRALAVDGDKKMSFDSDGRKSAGMMGFIPLVGLFAQGSVKLRPEVLYDAGNYYQFVEKKKALRANEAEMNDPYINPMEEWNTMKTRLTLPEELGMFTGDNSITFVESGTIVKKNVEIPFDKYVKTIKSVTDKDISATTYLVYYNNKGELDKISSVVTAPDEDAVEILNAKDDKSQNILYDTTTITIKKLTKELPPNVMDFPKGCKVYGPGLGDMNELIEQPPLLEEH